MALNLQIKHTGVAGHRSRFAEEEEDVMKRKTTAILLVMVVSGMMMTGPAIGGGSRADLEAIINDYIANGEAKAAMLNSSSENIRRAAVHVIEPNSASHVSGR